MLNAACAHWAAVTASLAARMPCLDARAPAPQSRAKACVRACARASVALAQGRTMTPLLDGGGASSFG
eukprot:8036796-Alexandrium_andersonii.AAC.1